MSLVEQLQAEALQQNADLMNLLQKAFVVATKLNLRKFKKWVRCELDGYSGVTIPDYRVLQGRLSVDNPFHGIQPFYLHDPKAEALVSTYYCADSVAEIGHLISSNRPDFAFRFPPDLRNYLSGLIGNRMVEPVLAVGSYQIKGILDRVKTVLIEWSLELEKDGIMGEGMRFSEMEKEKADKDEDKLTPTFIVNIIGNMENSQLQQHSPNADQNH